ncbi:MAG: sensor histidine kinase [Chloroflexi bacterium]|nr:sensor histidine kinase [Chloroflexota bacterium]
MTDVIAQNDDRQYPAYSQSCYNVVMMKQASLEPGLLSVFRLFAGLHFGIALINVLARDDSSELFSLIGVALLTVYLWWPGLPNRLGRAFLPLGLVLAAAGPIFGHYFELPAELDERELSLVHDISVLALILLIPLILVGWQYNFRAVLVYCVGTTALEVGLTILSIGQGNPYTRSLFTVIQIRTIFYLLIGYIIVRLVTAQRQQRQALTQANAQLAQYATTLEQLAVSRERNRLAGELHDTLAHTLSGTAVQLEAVKTLWETDPAQARKMLEQSLQAIRTGLTETRRTLQALRASPLEELGLALAVRRLAESVAEQTGAKLDWQGPDQVDKLTPAVEQGVYRVAQEALANVAKHAVARHLTVRLVQNNGRLSLQVADDGRGFELNRVDVEHHFGLKGMRERAEMIGGALKVKSQSEDGTIVQLVVEGI